MRRLATAICLASAALGLVPVAGRAQLPLHPPEIRTVFPIGGGRGAAVDVRVEEGVNIGDATGVVVSGEGVAAEVVGPDGGVLSPGAPPSARVVNNTLARVRFRVAPGAEQGLREFRLYTPVGLSCRGLFLVGPPGPNVTAEGPGGAAEIPVPGSADGRLVGSEDTGRFRFQARAGDSLAFYIQSREAECSLDSVLTLKDAAGKVVAANDDFLGKDSALAFTAPAAGDYTLEVRDVDNSGGPAHGYRVVATRAPCVRTTYPLGAPAGMLADVSLFGLNMGPIGKTTDFYSVDFDAAQARVQMPAVAGKPKTFQAATTAGFTNPFRLQVLDVPDVREQEPNDETEQAVRVPVPGAAHGRIFGSAANPRGDVDRWKFAGKKGKKLRLAVTAMRQGSTLDGLLAVRSASGEKLAGNDDAGGSRDPALEFDPPADGDYVAEMADTSGGGAIDAVYMVRIDPVEPPPPGFSLTLYPVNPSVPRGGSVPVEVRVSRTGGFGGPLQFELPPLPQGVTALIPPEAATMERFYIALRAAADAPYAFAPFGVKGTGTIGGSAVSREATGQERVWKNAPLHAVDTVLQQIAVCEPMDFVVSLDRERLELKPGESKDVKVIIRKIRGYPRGIPIRAATVDYGGGALPAGLSVGRVTLAAEASDVMVSVSASTGTRPGEYTVFICGLSNPSTNDYILVAQLAPPLKVVVSGN